MTGSQRTVFGHAVMGVGLALRRFSSPLCVATGVVLAGWSLLHAASGGGEGFPNVIPFHAGAHVGLAGWVLAGILALAALLLALRLLAVTIGAVGWLLLPTQHRDMLSRLSAPR
ncbi:MAG: hypothetical protein DLM61_00660 [Pseudonocardiales bacterium]|nr:MAG: hypothetical protein DLM61_00660 [Pseudonocardiales bacterium]